MCRRSRKSLSSRISRRRSLYGPSTTLSRHRCLLGCLQYCKRSTWLENPLRKGTLFEDFARYTQPLTSPASIVISIPVDLSEDAELAKLEEKGVKGRYVSVELLQELDDGKVEWRMATSSTPGGNIPSFVAESTMASTIAKVCILFATCIFSHKELYAGCDPLLALVPHGTREARDLCPGSRLLNMHAVFCVIYSLCISGLYDTE